MSKLSYFYATRDDLLAVTSRVESEVPIEYTRFGHTTLLPPECFSSAAQIPHLGTASHSSAVACEKFLVCYAETAIRPEQLKTLTKEDVNRSIITNKESLRPFVGVDRYAIDQLLNPDTICFAPGGIWKGGILLRGGIDTASQSEYSLALMKKFRTVIKMSFVKIAAFYVGPEALMLLKSGTRLTVSAQSPQEFDLTIT
jgi:hypothetical protein